MKHTTLFILGFVLSLAGILFVGTGVQSAAAAAVMPGKPLTQDEQSQQKGGIAPIFLLIIVVAVVVKAIYCCVENDWHKQEPVKDQYDRPNGPGDFCYSVDSEVVSKTGDGDGTCPEYLDDNYDDVATAADPSSCCAA